MSGIRVKNTVERVIGVVLLMVAASRRRLIALTVLSARPLLRGYLGDEVTWVMSHDMKNC